MERSISFHLNTYDDVARPGTLGRGLVRYGLTLTLLFVVGCSGESRMSEESPDADAGAQTEESVVGAEPSTSGFEDDLAADVASLREGFSDRSEAAHSFHVEHVEADPDPAAGDTLPLGAIPRLAPFDTAEETGRSPIVSRSIKRASPNPFRASSERPDFTAAPKRIESSSAPVLAELVAAEGPRAVEAAKEEPIEVSSAEPKAVEADSTDTAAAQAPGDTDSSEAYDVVTVFYGTDRASTMATRPLREQVVVWFYATAISGVFTILLVVMTLRYGRSPAVAALATVSLAATVLLGIAMVAVRQQTTTATPQLERAYGGERGKLVMGTCDVSIPKTHKVGNLERPSIFTFDFVETPEKHIALLSIDEKEADPFFAELQSRVEESKQREAFVFVHGFNVTFEAAAHRTAQLSFDLQFDGAPIFYSWPSQGGLFQYTVDESNVQRTVPHLKEFLTAVARRSGADSVHLVAHSMGNRALTDALHQLSFEMQAEQPMFAEILLTAPDIDADYFQSTIAPAIVKTSKRVTLYASKNDEALNLSKKLHGYPRAGDSEQIVIAPGVDTIDVSAVDTSLIGHSYYGNNRTVITDMVELLHEAKPPTDRRWLTEWAGPTSLETPSVYWIFDLERSSARALPPQWGEAPVTK